jgi:uncharacterized protein
MKITATDLYSYIKCPHRVWRDAFDDPKLKDLPNEFVQLLWERGVAHEREVLAKQKGEFEILDLSGVPMEKRLAQTLEAMRKKAPYIYQGYLEIEELVGRPDLLELQPHGEYIPIDIKSGMGYEGGEEGDDGKLKKEYVVQIGLYVDSLVRLGFLSHNFGRVLDSSGGLIDYDLNTTRGAKIAQTWWEFYLSVLGEVKHLYEKDFKTEPALGGECKLCEWYTDCKNQCVESSSVTLVPELGRSRKEALKPVAKNIQELAKMDVKQFTAAKAKFGIKGIAEPMFEKMNRRARLLSSGQKDPLILERFTLPEKPIELFFDIEADPTQDIIYLHGVIERGLGSKDAVFHSFVTEDVSEREEKRAWADFWSYLRSLPEDGWALYYYSKYERTQYRALSERYQDIASEEEVEWLFDPGRSVDLYYDIVKKYTEWPTYDYSIKTLAQHLGFKWRDENPSGAASIQWFNEWCETKEPKVMKRILEYNEDDCRAMMVLKDKFNSLLRA